MVAHWNSTKGGSEVTTKMICKFFVRISKAHINMEYVPVSRMPQLRVRCLHSLIIGKRKETCSLKNYRNAENKYGECY